MSSLPSTVHTAAQVRAIDPLAIVQLKIPGYTLMSRAGEAALDVLQSAWPNAQRLLVLCGQGNNGGDGYVIARLASQQGLAVSVVAFADPAALRGDAHRAWEDFASAGGVTRDWNEARLQDVDVVVDAVFGTGLSRPVDSVIASCFEAVNAASVPVLSIDIPSGLSADDGHVLGAAIRADRTVTFIGLKMGFYLGEGPSYVGDISFNDLGVPRSLAAEAGAIAQRIEVTDVRKLLPPRKRTAHKGEQGRLLIIGGNTGMAGATRMSGEAALRVGAGLVTIATRAENTAAITVGRPELMCRSVEHAEQLQTLIERADVVAIGPGLGQDAWARELFEAAISADKLMVLDADALNLLAETSRTSQRWILTPHPGEAGRLLGLSTAEIQADRLRCAQEIATRYGGIAVLKGAGTLVVQQDALPWVCDRGNPGMATAGMGDVLTGVIAGILSQTRDLAGAARVGVLSHAMAGDLAAERGQRGVIASDLFQFLRSCVNP